MNERSGSRPENWGSSLTPSGWVTISSIPPIDRLFGFGVRTKTRYRTNLYYLDSDRVISIEHAVIRYGDKLVNGK